MGFWMELCKGLLTIDSRREEERLEREMDKYHLNKWQREEVRKGRYKPSNFEQEGELDEEDYYYEDD